MQVYADSALIT